MVVVVAPPKTNNFNLRVKNQQKRLNAELQRKVFELAQHAGDSIGPQSSVHTINKPKSSLGA